MEKAKMTTTNNSTLPNPQSEKIKLGKSPRRSYRLWCHYADRPGKHRSDDHTDPVMGRKQARLNGALAHLAYMTTAEADKLVAQHDRMIAKNIKKHAKDGHSEAAIDNWVDLIEARDVIHTFAWIHDELKRVHGIQRVIDRLAGVAIWAFNGLSNERAAAWVKMAEARDAERRAIDDEAFAALASILSNEGVKL